GRLPNDLAPQAGTPKRSGGGGLRKPTAVAEVDRGLPDGLKLFLDLRVGIKVRLDLVPDLVPGLALQAREEVVRGGVRGEVVRRVERDAGHDERQLGRRAGGWTRAWGRLGRCSRGGPQKHRTSHEAGTDRSHYRGTCGT